jgi:uncharacterized integral membrane protein
MSSDPPVTPGRPQRLGSQPTTEPPPHTTPATTPASTTTVTPQQAPAVEPKSAVKFTRAGALWSGLIVGFLILIVLLVFIAQNTDSAEFAFLGWHWSQPLGVAILLAAVCGGLITVLAGSTRIFQLRRAAKKNLKLTPP